MLYLCDTISGWTGREPGLVQGEREQGRGGLTLQPQKQGKHIQTAFPSLQRIMGKCWPKQGENTFRTPERSNLTASLTGHNCTSLSKLQRESLFKQKHAYLQWSLTPKKYICCLYSTACYSKLVWLSFFHGRFETWHKSYGPQIILLLCFWSFYSLTTQIPIYLLSIYHMENGQYIMQHFSCCGKMKEESQVKSSHLYLYSAFNNTNLSHMGFKQYEVE